MTKIDKLTTELASKYYSTPDIKLEDLLKLQRKWAPMFKEARSLVAFVGQKYHA